MSAVQRFVGSTVGKKVIMAITGLVMVGFVVAHVAGNLLVFRGARAMNDYAAFLKSTGGLLWIARAVLLASVVLHVWSAVTLTRINAAARPVPYVRVQPRASTIASRTMTIGGLVLAAFIVFHILHFTTGTIQPVPFSATDVYANMVGAFRIGWVVAVYLVAMVALGLHLFHGFWSSFRTLGASRPSPNPLRRRVATGLAFAVWLGFSIIPIAILAGIVR